METLVHEEYTVMESSSIDEIRKLAIRHHQAGRLSEAEQAYRRILSEQPCDALTLRLLATLAREVSRNDVALQLITRSIAIDPQVAESHSELGNILQTGGRHNKAIEAYRHALSLRPNFAAAHNNLGTAYRNTGRLDEALGAYRRAVNLQPGYGDALFNLGLSLWETGDLEGSIRCYRDALNSKGDDPDIHYNLAVALQDDRQLDDAITEYLEVIRLKPNHANAHNNLANAYKEQGRIGMALQCHRSAVAIKPEAADLHSNLLYTLAFHSGYDAEMIRIESEEWDRRHGQPMKTYRRAHQNDRTPGRRLRIGYVSPDFSNHVVAHNLLPLLREHDRGSFEIFCYSCTPRPDAITSEVRSKSDTWREIEHVTDEDVDNLIRSDEIDILIDLTLHMGKNRLPLFARKPAPVQCSYLASCSTSGMDSIDFRFTDSYLDALASPTDCYTEELVRLPHSAWCYKPSAPMPEVSPLPAHRNGFITFGSRNNPCKVNDVVLDTWFEILQAVPDSRLILTMPEGKARDLVSARLARHDLGPDRLEFVGRQPWNQFIEGYHRIDIGLDPFPYSGWITSCDALRMGIPIVSFADRTALGRGGKTILSNIGLPELVADTLKEYVSIAVSLANDLPRLTMLRVGLRSRIDGSPLRDAARHARSVEEAYRMMWRRWCTQGAMTGDDA